MLILTYADSCYVYICLCMYTFINMNTNISVYIFVQIYLLLQVQELVEATEPDHVAAEAADVLYFMMTRCVAAGVGLREIEGNHVYVLYARDIYVSICIYVFYSFYMWYSYLLTHKYVW
jgi:hypothetical protein